MSGGQSVVAPFARVTKPDEVVRFAQVLCSAFSNDPLNRYLFLGRESRPDHPKLADDAEEKLEYWLPGTRKRFEKGSVLVQSSNWAAVALWCVNNPFFLLYPFQFPLDQTTTTSISLPTYGIPPPWAVCQRGPDPSRAEGQR